MILSKPKLRLASYSEPSGAKDMMTLTESYRIGGSDLTVRPSSASVSPIGAGPNQLQPMLVIDLAEWRG